MKTNGMIRNAVTAALSGAVIAGAAVYLITAHLDAKRQHEAFELSNSTLAATRLAALSSLRDNGTEETLAMLEEALTSDLYALRQIANPTPATKLMIRRITDYQKKYPPPAELPDIQDTADFPEGSPSLTPAGREDR